MSLHTLLTFAQHAWRRAVNVPTHLLTHLRRQKEQLGVEALLIHISTDQAGRQQHATC